MVVALKKGSTDDILLEFSQVIPFYISPNEKIGTEESEHFFPFDYDDGEQEVVAAGDHDVSSDEDKENVDVDYFVLNEH